MEIQDSELHTQHIGHPAYVTAVKGIKTASSKRSLKVTLAVRKQSDLSTEYRDKFGNFVFKDKQLIEDNPILTLRPKQTEPQEQNVNESSALQLANQMLLNKLKTLARKMECKATDEKLVEFGAS